MNDEEILRRAESDLKQSSPPSSRWTIGGAVVLLMIAAGVYLADWGREYAIYRYTSPRLSSPRRLQVSSEQVRSARDKWNNLALLTRSNVTAGNIELTADELNVLLWADPLGRDLNGDLSLRVLEDDIYEGLLGDRNLFMSKKGSILISVVGGRIFAEVSVPLKRLGIKEHGDRFLSFRSEVTARFGDGEPTIRLRGVEVKGQRLPKLVQERIASMNLFALLVEDRPIYGEFANRIERFSVRNDKISISLRENALATGAGRSIYSNKRRLPTDEINRQYDKLREWNRKAELLEDD